MLIIVSSEVNSILAFTNLLSGTVAERSIYSRHYKIAICGACACVSASPSDLNTEWMTSQSRGSHPNSICKMRGSFYADLKTVQLACYIESFCKIPICMEIDILVHLWSVSHLYLTIR